MKIHSPRLALRCELGHKRTELGSVMAAHRLRRQLFTLCSHFPRHVCRITARRDMLAWFSTAKVDFLKSLRMLVDEVKSTLSYSCAAPAVPCWS